MPASPVSRTMVGRPARAASQRSPQRRQLVDAADQDTRGRRVLHRSMMPVRRRAASASVLELVEHAERHAFQLLLTEITEAKWRTDHRVGDGARHEDLPGRGQTLDPGTDVDARPATSSFCCSISPMDP